MANRHVVICSVIYVPNCRKHITQTRQLLEWLGAKSSRPIAQPNIRQNALPNEPYLSSSDSAPHHAQ